MSIRKISTTIPAMNQWKIPLRNRAKNKAAAVMAEKTLSVVLTALALLRFFFNDSCL